MSTIVAHNPWRVTPRLCADMRNAVVQLHNAYLRDDQRATDRRNTALGALVDDLRLCLDNDPNPQYYDAAQALVGTLLQLERTTAHPYDNRTAAEQARTALEQIKTLESLLD